MVHEQGDSRPGRSPDDDAPAPDSGLERFGSGEDPDPDSEGLERLARAEDPDPDSSGLERFSHGDDPPGADDR